MTTLIENKDSSSLTDGEYFILIFEEMKKLVCPIPRGSNQPFAMIDFSGTYTMDEIEKY